MKCTEPNLLLLKATSHSTVMCLDQCLSVLRTQHSTVPHNSSAVTRYSELQLMYLILLM